MSRRIGVIAAMAMFLMSFSAQAEEGALVDNVFYQSDLRQALEDVAAQAGVNIIADPSVQGLVSVTIEQASVEKALDLLLAGTEYEVEKTSDYYLVYSPDVNSDFFTNVAETRIVKLQHVSPETARSLLPETLQRYVRFEKGSTTRVAVTAPAQIMERILHDIAEIDKGNGETIFIALRHIQAERARDLLPENLQRFVRVDPDRNTIAITAPERSAPVIVEQLQRLDVPLPKPSTDAPTLYPTRIVKLNHATAEGALKLLPEAVSSYVKGDPKSNTVSVNAPPGVLDQIMRDIADIDVPRNHIMLEARVVVMGQNDLLEFGTEYDFGPVRIGNDFDGDVSFPYEVRIGYSPTQVFTEALTLTLNLLTQNDEATTVASPKVLAQDGVPSQIKVTTEEYFQIVNQSGNFIQSDLETIETGTILEITPRVGRNGSLTLDMKLEVSDVVARGKMDLPVVSRRTAHSTVELENGGTAAVAGLVGSRTQMGRAGLPGLTGLPFLGRAFRTDSLDHKATQVAIFVTATLVDQEDPRFRTGRSTLPSAQLIDEEIFRAQLVQALNTLGVQE